jgi:hypothetical protein
MGLEIRERMVSKSGRDSIVVSFERRVLACLSVQLGKELGRALQWRGSSPHIGAPHTVLRGSWRLEMKNLY